MHHYSKLPCSFTWDNIKAFKLISLLPYFLLIVHASHSSQGDHFKIQITLLRKILQWLLIWIKLKLVISLQRPRNLGLYLLLRLFLTFPPSFMIIESCCPCLFHAKPILMPMANDLVNHAYLMKPPLKKSKRTGFGERPELVNTWKCGESDASERAWELHELIPYLALCISSGYSWAIYFYNKPVI